MAVIGSIEQFDVGTSDWPTYAARLDQFIAANAIDEDKKVATLLTAVGSATYKLLQNLLAPDKPSDKDYDQLCKALKDHLAPKPLIIAERYRFHKRDQRSGETTAQYIAELRRLARNCDFGGHLADALRDRFVSGVTNHTICKSLLSEDGLTLAKAEKMATAMETAARDAAELTPSNRQNVHRMVMKPRAQETCYRCGKTGHSHEKCHYRNAICRGCGKSGHLQAVCRSSKKTESKKTGRQQRRAGPKYRQGRKVVNALEDEGELEIAALDTEKTPKDAIWVSPRINGTKVTMELDTGSAVSVIPVSTFKKQFPKTKLQPTPVHLRTYCGNRLRTLGKTTVAIELNGQKAQDDVYIVDSTGPPLFGRTWLRKLQLDWKEIHSVTASPKERLDKLTERYTEIFKTDLGCLQGVYGSLSLCKDATPKFVKARPVPYALRPKIESELERMEAEGIVKPIQWSEWATPIVLVVKPNGTVRICGDFKVTVNPQLKVDQYPLPLNDDIFASLAGGKKFSKIDLRSAYTQMKMTDNSKPMLTLNTHRGLFRLNRLAFGIASAPAIWQRAIDQVLSGLTKTRCILDDIIVTGEDDEEHFQNLEAVFKRLQTAGLRVNSKKCRFFADRIEYCGHEVSKDGLRKLKTKIQAIVDAPRPENVSQLRSFLGLLNYYQRFLPDLATTLHPLNNLLHKGTKFDWCTDCQAAFKKVKNLIASDQVLTHYDPRLPVRLASDASPYGIGAVLSHVYPTGEERPIAFASRTLTQAEKGYSQIDKEALAIIWAVKRFNIYLYGRQFELVTDHQPLISIFNPEKGIPTMTAARLQRYALFLAGHDYTIMYKQTKEHANADSMSRLPLPCTEPPTAAVQDVDIFHASQVHALPVTAQKVKKETRNDPLLAKVYNYALRGWPQHCTDDQLKPFATRKDELTLHDGCILWGSRVIIPKSLQATLLHELHEGHLGMVRMKALARSYFWWPRLDTDIETTARSCNGCQQSQKNPATAPLHPWEWPAQPWQRLHVDFAGPIDNFMYLIVVDAHSKWPEVIPMRSTTATRTISKLRQIFAQHGIPEQIVSDNGPQFASEEFADFAKANGIRHIRSAPYHPATNGLAERFVQTFKNALKASRADAIPFQDRLVNFLLRYRNTPHATTNTSPAMLLMKRPLRTRFDLVRPDLGNIVTQKQLQQAQQLFSSPRSFAIGDHVMARDYRPDQAKWTPGIVSQINGPLSYDIEVAPRVTWKRHVDQLRPGHPQLSADSPVEDSIAQAAQLAARNADSAAQLAPHSTPDTQPAETRSTNQSSKPVSVELPLRRYPVRERKESQRLKY